MTDVYGKMNLFEVTTFKYLHVYDFSIFSQKLMISNNNELSQILQILALSLSLSTMPKKRVF